MKLHTANKYLSSLPRKSEKGLVARFDALREATLTAVGADVALTVLLTVSGEEHSFVCRAAMAALAHAGYNAALISLDPEAPLEEMVHIGKNAVSDDEAAQVATAVRQAAVSLGITPTLIEAKLLCALALCSRKGCKNVIVGFDPMNIPHAFYDIFPSARTVALLPSEASVSESSSIVRKGVLEVISAPRGEEEYRAISAVCAKVNCRHSVISRSAVASPTLTYKGIEFLYKDRKYSMRGHSESMIAEAVAAILAARALERRGFKISEGDVGAILPDVAVEYGCRIVSYNPCVIALVCRNGRPSPQIRSDAERVCAHFDKPLRLFSEFSGDTELEDAFGSCYSGECALCVEGTPHFVRDTLNALEGWISPPVK